MGFAAFSCGALLLVAASLLLSASLRLQSLTAFLLAAYLLAVAVLVGLAELLSPFHDVTRVGYLVSVALVAGGSGLIWFARGRPLAPRLPVSRFVELRTHPMVCLLGICVALGLVYELVVGVTTPPNNWDSMWHHLVRVAAWRQQHAVDYVPNVNSSFGVNDSPPNGELQILFGVVLLGRDTFATIPQFLGECALLLSVFGIARRVGFEFVPATFAALLSATLSIVALESVTTQNDLTVAAAVTVAVFFLLGNGGVDFALAGLAIGLALGTKLTTVIALPAVALLVVVAGGMRRLVVVSLTSAVSFAAFGAFIYLRTHATATGVAGTRTGEGAVRAALSATNMVSTASRVLYRFVDLSGLVHLLHGKPGLIVSLLVLPALAGTAVVAMRSVRSPKVRVWVHGIAGAALVPALAVGVAIVGRGLFAALHIPLNPRDATSTGRFNFAVNARADEGLSYFGPLGVFLVWPLSLGGCVAWARRDVNRRIGALAATLPLSVLVFAATLSFTPFVGRYFIAPVALVMPLAAFVYMRSRLLAHATALVAVIALVLGQAFNEGKPVGLTGSPPIWSLSRADAQAVERPAMRSVLERVAEQVPRHAHVDVDLLERDWSYPFYGSQLGRTVTYLSPGLSAGIPADSSWLIAHVPRPHGGGWLWRITKPKATS